MKLKKALLIFSVLVLNLLLVFVGFFFARYKTEQITEVKLQELSHFDYPENPANLSTQHGRYNDRKLKIIQKDQTHFDLILEPKEKNNPQISKIIFKNIDISLFVTGKPSWIKDQNLEIIAITDREWNRQQASFGRDSQNLEISKEGFDAKNLYSAALAKNCLNAGYWEILLSSKENNKKALYYQAWFTFPIGHYKKLFEQNSQRKYLKHLWRLEHWVDPEGLKLNLNQIRQVLNEKKTNKAQFLGEESVFAYGEQARKIRTSQTINIKQWQDFYKRANYPEIKFATFFGSGQYRNQKPWSNEYWRIAKFQEIKLREIKTKSSEKKLQELEISFKDQKTGQTNRLLVGGIDLEKTPQLPVKEYYKGFYMPMGISVPPFYQSYQELLENNPLESTYYSLLLDQENRWLNHHDIALDGSVIHKDQSDPGLFHLYLLSYERHTLIGHFIFSIKS